MTNSRLKLRKNRSLPLLGLALAALSLGACDSLRQAVGIDKSVPDESKVTQTPPLSIPPDFALRPPQPGQAGAPASADNTMAGQQVTGQRGQAAPGQAAAAPYGAYPSANPTAAATAPGYAPAGYPAAGYPATGYAPTQPASGGTDAYFQQALNQYSAQPGARDYNGYPVSAPQPAYQPPGYYTGYRPAEADNPPPASTYPTYYPPAAPAYPAPPASQTYNPTAYPAPYSPPAYPQPAYQQPGTSSYPSYNAPGYQPPPAATSASASGVPAPAYPAPGQTGIPPAPPGQVPVTPAPAGQSAPGADAQTCGHMTVDAWGDYTCQ